MSPTGISRTAFGAAYMRAAHLLLDKEPHILEDDVALKLIGSNGTELIKQQREEFSKEHYLHLRSHVLLRARYAEDRLMKSLERGIKQYIVLGAGLDTFGYRQPAWAHVLRIFEVDMLETQKTKIKLLEQHNIRPPDNVVYIPIDFEKDSLKEVLINCGVDFGTPTFISWLGVTMYLDTESIDAVLKVVKTFPSKSEIVFSYAEKRDKKSIFEMKSDEFGETWKSLFSQREIEELLSSNNYSEIFPLDRREYDMYFNHRIDGLPEPNYNRIFSAIV
jgi:methyltransferase (TIGR00027 family)